MIEPEKRNAALQALEREVRDGQRLGVGTGSTVAYFIEELGKRVRREGWEVACVPSSLRTESLCLKAGLKLVSLDEEPRLDVTIDGADEIDSKLNLIKGGGGALTREKILASASERLAIIADKSKLVKRLGENHPVPIEVLPFALGFVKDEVRKLRPVEIAVRKIAGGKDGPMITDNGNSIIDLYLGPIKDPAQVSAELNSIPGILENGIFLEMTDVVYLGEGKTVRFLE